MCHRRVHGNIPFFQSQIISELRRPPPYFTNLFTQSFQTKEEFLKGIVIEKLEKKQCVDLFATNAK